MKFLIFSFCFNWNHVHVQINIPLRFLLINKDENGIFGYGKFGTMFTKKAVTFLPS